MPRIAVLGNFVVDIIGKPIDRLPERGRLLMIETLETHAGGNGPNTAGALGKLGAEAAVAGRVGDDLYGRFLLERLREWRVDTSMVRRDPAASTGVTLVPVDRSGERSFLHHFGANARFGPADLDWDALSTADHLHLGGFFVLPGLDGEAAAAVLKEARLRGLTTSVDVCWDRDGRWMEALRPCLPHTDLLAPSEEEARELTGRAAPAAMAAVFRAEGARTVVIKCGEKGCYYAGDEGDLAVPAFAVDVRDTTGAGDCFIAGLLYARAAGWELPRALRFANACGARSVREVGGVTGVAAAGEIQAWAAAQPIRK